MALFTAHHDAARVVAAARRWVERGLIEDGSVFGDEALHTRAHFDALDRHFVQRPDEGSGGFYQKLQGQLADAPPAASKLMAELLWALFLFPSNISEQTKRDGVLRTWGFSGDQLDPNHPLLADAVLDGVGSAGMGVNSNRWREINFLIALGQSIKALAPAERRAVLQDYDRFLAWIAQVPQEGNRQFRHMLRYLLFPERVERMSSNGDRKRVLAAFKVAQAREIERWSDRQLDDAMLALRREQELRLGTTDIDFYVEPLRSMWKNDNEPDEGVNETAEAATHAAPAGDALAVHGRKPRNLILYGPPGTGKTWRLQQQFFRDYTDKAADLDHATWLQQLVTPVGWREVVAAALAALGGSAGTEALEMQELVIAKARQRQRERHLRATLWNTLQSHASPDCAHVNVAVRRAPFLFHKNAASVWSVLPQWGEADPAAAELHDAWKAGQQARREDVRRYRMVTFHPSYTYEDFVVGLRPVARGDDGGTVFRMVDGVFKQICAEARANPGKRYALFVDEINRANIAKVFGELITLIEPDKRARYDAAGRLLAGVEVQLPGTGGEEGADERFGVPENLDLIGTMNTADRSIALLDIALRRRFEFQEMAPDYSALRHRIGQIDLARLLRRLNDRIEFLADRDRLIGHAYFTRATDLAGLRGVFRDQVIPLLQEYFFDDFARVELVLSTADGSSPFFARETLAAADLFGRGEVGGDVRVRYRVTSPEGWSEEAFRALYEGAQSAT